MKNVNLEVRIHSPYDLAKSWYVYIYDLAEKRIVKKNYHPLNQYTTFEERMWQALEMKKFMESELRAGWAPKSVLPQVEDMKYSFEQGYTAGVEYVKSSGISLPTIRHYNTHIKQVVQAVRALGFSKVPIRNFETYHISLILDECQRQHKGSNDHYNKHLKAFKRVFRELCARFIVSVNVAAPLSDKHHETKDKRLLTPDEYAEVRDCFDKYCPNFALMMECVEIGVRPEECRNLRIGMIKSIVRNYKRVHFFDIPASIAKNDKRRLVPINKELLAKLPAEGAFPDHFYLFGIPYKRCRDLSHRFAPSETQVGKNAANNIWRKIVKEKLDIESDFYYLKSKSANDMRDRGIDLNVIKDLYGHSDEEITKIYATRDYEIRMLEVAEILTDEGKSQN